MQAEQEMYNFKSENAIFWREMTDREMNAKSRASSYSPTLATLPEASTPCLNLAPPPGPATRHRVKSRTWQHVTTGPWQLPGDSGGGKQIKEALKPRSISKPILSAQIYKASTTVLRISTVWTETKEIPKASQTRIRWTWSTTTF
jgi:hypothetical protein